MGLAWLNPAWKLEEVWTAPHDVAGCGRALAPLVARPGPFDVHPTEGEVSAQGFRVSRRWQGPSLQFFGSRAAVTEGAFEPLDGRTRVYLRTTYAPSLLGVVALLAVLWALGLAGPARGGLGPLTWTLFLLAVFAAVTWAHQRQAELLRTGILTALGATAA